MGGRRRFAQAGMHNRALREQGVTRAEQRRDIDRRLLEVLAGGPVPYKRCAAAVFAPKAQVWARMQRLIKSGQVVWVHGGKRLERRW